MLRAVLRFVCEYKIAEYLPNIARFVTLIIYLYISIYIYIYIYIIIIIMRIMSHVCRCIPTDVLIYKYGS